MQPASFIKSLIVPALAVFLLCSPGYAAVGMDAAGSYIGAVNSGASSLTIYVSSPPSTGETILLVGYWAGQSLTASVSDGTGNKYTAISGPVKMAGGVVNAQAWYCVNSYSPRSFSLTLSGSSIGGAFDGILLSVVSLTGLSTTSPLDTATVNTATGTGPNMAVTSGVPSQSAETMLAVFMGQKAETPWSAGSGWTEIDPNGSQEAVTEFELKTITGGGAQSATATGNASTNWLGFIFGFYPASQTGLDPPKALRLAPKASSSTH